MFGCHLISLARSNFYQKRLPVDFLPTLWHWDSSYRCSRDIHLSLIYYDSSVEVDQVGSLWREIKRNNADSLLHIRTLTSFSPRVGDPWILYRLDTTWFQKPKCRIYLGDRTTSLWTIDLTRETLDRSEGHVTPWRLVTECSFRTPFGQG